MPTGGDKWEKKRRRERRKQRRQTRRDRGSPLASIMNLLSVPGPAAWPGTADASLERPDQIKYAYAMFAINQEPGRSHYQPFEQRLLQGPLGELGHLDHWAMEEFLWHGAPGDAWQPMDAFLRQAGRHFPPAAVTQLRRWQQAKIGLYEIGPVEEDTVALQEWDPVQRMAVGPKFRAIDLCIGGTNSHKQQTGQVLLTYVAPWAPAQGICCALGYGSTLPKEEADGWLLYLNLRHADAMSRPLPWNLSAVAADKWLRQWQERPWNQWLRERLSCPFLALLPLGPKGKPVVKRVTSLIPSTEEEGRSWGIYFALDEYMDGEPEAVGATAVMPLDVTSPNFAPLLEYRSFRDRVGPPPATLNAKLVRGRLI